MTQASLVSTQLERRLTSFSHSALQLKSSLEDIVPHLASLQQIHDSFRQFNRCFANYLDALDMQASTMSFPVHTRRPVREQHVSLLTAPAPVLIKPSLERQPPITTDNPSDTEAVVVNPFPIRLPNRTSSANVKLNTKKLPPKYLGSSQRRILQELLNSLQDCYPDGMCLSELTAATGLSGIQAKEYAIVLMKQGHAERVKTHKGLTYKLKCQSDE